MIRFIVILMTLSIVVGIPLYLIINIFIKRIKKDYNSMSPLEKGMTYLYIVVSLFVYALYIGDKCNIFSTYGITTGLSRNYDWLNFLGTVVTLVINALFVLIITIQDRRENTESIRLSQRPNLCTRLYLPNNFRMTDTTVEGYIFQADEKKNTSEFYIIKISNSGQTVAIIDTTKSYFKAHKIEDERVPIDNTKSELLSLAKKYTIYFNKYEDRLHINSNKEANIVLIDNGLYRSDSAEGKASIDEVYIEYEDLFGKRYVDQIKIQNGKSMVEKDNVLIQ